MPGKYKSFLSAWREKIFTVPFLKKASLVKIYNATVVNIWRLSWDRTYTGFFVDIIDDMIYPLASILYMKQIVKSINITKLLVLQLFISRIPLICTSTLFDLHNKMIRGFLCSSARHKPWFYWDKNLNTYMHILRNFLMIQHKHHRISIIFLRSSVDELFVWLLFCGHVSS